MRRYLFFGLLLLGLSSAQATTIHVPSEQPTIQAGIDAAVGGDTVSIAAGTYTGTGNTNLTLQDKSIVIIGSSGPETTIIDGEDLAQYGFQFLESGYSIVVEGLTISGVQTGVYCEMVTLTISNCVFSHNQSAGVYTWGNCTVTESQFEQCGTALELWEGGIVEDCDFIDCGTGLMHSTSITCRRSSFLRNGIGIQHGYEYAVVDSCSFVQCDTAFRGSDLLMSHSTVDSCGIGIFIRTGMATMTMCSFIRNTVAVFEFSENFYHTLSQSTIADNWGEILSAQGSDEYSNTLTIEECEINNNVGGMSVGFAGLTMQNCLYVDNGGPIAVSGNLAFGQLQSTILECTIVNNSGSGIEVANPINFTLSVDSCVIAFNGGFGVSGINLFVPENVLLSCNDVFGNGGGNYSGITDPTGMNGNISEDPQFCDTANSDYHLDACSPCAPDRSSCATLVGALPVACSVQYCGPVWHVSTTGSDETGDGSELNPFATIQHGIDAAIAGDTVQVAAGTYTGDGNRDIDFGGKNLVVMSVDGLENTVIDCAGSHEAPHRGFLFQNGEDSTALVRGFTIHGGYGPFDFPGDGESTGGGIACLNSSSPTIADCLIDSCTAYHGGGISLYSSSANIVRCVFSQNSGYMGGGGRVDNGSPRFAECVFERSQATYGSGVFANVSSATLTSCTFDQNTGGAGGGLYVNSGSLTFNGCTFTRATASNAAAVFFWGGVHQMTNCTISRNSSTGGCAGIYAGDGTPVTMQDCIVAFNAGINTEAVYGGGLTLYCCDIFGNALGDWTGTIGSQLGVNGNITADPLFCDTADQNYHLHNTSPCHPDSSSCGLIGAYGVGCVGISLLGIESEPSLQNIIDHSPVFIWSYEPLDGFVQTEFEIAVGTDNLWDFAEMWNPSPFVTPDTFVLFAGAALLDGETYYTRLRISDGTDWTDWYETTFRMNSLPSVPTPTWPPEGFPTDAFPTLWVQNSTDLEADEITYDFVGYHDTDCVSGDTIGLVDVPEGADSTGGTVTAPLGENCLYWWKARAYDGYEYSEWSPTLMFYVDGIPEAPSIPVCQFPAEPGDSIIYEMLPTLSWTESTDPDYLDTVRYKLELSTDADFNFVLTRDSLPDTQYLISDSLAFHQPYWWRVTAFDKTSQYVMSDTSVFWTWTLGDLTYDHVTDVADLTQMIDHLFITFPPIIPEKLGDLTGDCITDVADLTDLIAHLFITFEELGVGCEASTGQQNVTASSTVSRIP